MRWYLRYALSYRDLEEMMNERGLSLDHTTIYRWVQAYAPELEKRGQLQKIKRDVAGYKRDVAEYVDFREKARLFGELESLNRSPALSPYRRVNALVIGRDSDSWFKTVLIDRGSIAGVEKDLPVTTPEGLVGRVVSVSPGSSRVLLITDERHVIIAQTAENRLLGVLRGKNQPICEMRFSAVPSKLENGELVITSGQDQLYPKGLLIGRVWNLNNSDAIPQAAEVELAAELDKLEAVAVLLIPREEVRRQYEELINEEKREKERENQDKTPGRRR